MGAKIENATPSTVKFYHQTFLQTPGGGPHKR